MLQQAVAGSLLPPLCTSEASVKGTERYVIQTKARNRWRTAKIIQHRDQANICSQGQNHHMTLSSPAPDTATAACCPPKQGLLHAAELTAHTCALHRMQLSKLATHSGSSSVVGTAMTSWGRSLSSVTRETTNRFFLLSGRQGTRSTSSPSWQLLSSSWAKYFVVLLRSFL